MKEIECVKQCLYSFLCEKILVAWVGAKLPDSARFQGTTVPILLPVND